MVLGRMKFLGTSAADLCTAYFSSVYCENPTQPLFWIPDHHARYIFFFFLIIDTIFHLREARIVYGRHLGTSGLVLSSKKQICLASCL